MSYPRPPTVRGSGSPLGAPAPGGSILLSPHKLQNPGFPAQQNRTAKTGGKLMNLPSSYSTPPGLLGLGSRAGLPSSGIQIPSASSTENNPNKYTLHLNTSKGQTVFQVQQQAGLLGPVINTPAIITSRQGVSPFVPQLSSRVYPCVTGVRPTAVPLPPTALIRPSVAPYLLPHPSGASVLGGSSKSLLVSMGHQVPVLGPNAVMPPLGKSSSCPPTTIQQSPGASSAGGTPTTPGQSPRPSILRKRPSEVAAAGGASNGSSAARKLVYEPANLDLRSTTTKEPDNFPVSTELQRNDSPSRSSVASEEASNHSTASGNSTDQQTPSSSQELSPRKRPRKQQFEKPPSPPKVKPIRLPPNKTPPMAAPQKKRKKTTMAVQKATTSTEQRPASAATTSSASSGDVDKGEEATPEPDSDPETGIQNGDRMTPLLHQIYDSLRAPQVKLEPGAEYRPRPSLLALSGFRLDHSPRRNHFKRPESIKLLEKKKKKKKADEAEKEEKRQLDEAGRLANDQSIRCRMSPFKLVLLERQLEDLEQSEWNNYQALLNCQEDAENNLAGSEEERKLVREMALTCAQRNKALSEQIQELRKYIRGFWEKHGTALDSRLAPFVSKRPVRSKRAKKSPASYAGLE